MAGGRPKEYKSAKALSAAVEAYFASISRTATVKERVDTGEKDSDGHKIYEEREVCNDAGQPIRYTEYLLPPTVGGLSDALFIHRSTWTEYCDARKHPEFSDTTTRAQGRMRAWNEQQLLTRKDVKGIIFNLTNNYEYRERAEVEMGPRAARVVAAANMSMSEKTELLLQMRREAFGTEDGADAGADTDDGTNANAATDADGAEPRAGGDEGRAETKP